MELLLGAYFNRTVVRCNAESLLLTFVSVTKLWFGLIPIGRGPTGLDLEKHVISQLQLPGFELTTFLIAKEPETS